LNHLIICLSNDIQYSWGVFGGSIKGKLLHAAWLPEITIKVTHLMLSLNILCRRLNLKSNWNTTFITGIVYSIKQTLNKKSLKIPQG
jgi:hypothetical protein